MVDAGVKTTVGAEVAVAVDVGVGIVGRIGARERFGLSELGQHPEHRVVAAISPVEAMLDVRQQVGERVRVDVDAQPRRGAAQTVEVVVEQRIRPGRRDGVAG
ncbi:hypothetical protein KIV56_06135 [Cryobacterium breve]|uniref:Asp23/Gls24 family envelope stress response protein n=1 Tax=Cryobacterium breve TaxID=1259258 RepID=A0ABY7NEE6_9MICO|nr:hypothetical protein [Cryobacterium breve]WBM80884.1 hypothetical protein KIV56_06135 [Cryobacterium breve]